MPAKRGNWGDRYDARGSLVGLGVAVLLGLIFGALLHGGLGLWLAAAAIASGVASLTSSMLRRRAGGLHGRPPHRRHPGPLP